MKIGELQYEIEELEQSIEGGEQAHLGTQLRELLKSLDNESQVAPELMVSVRAILDAFWQWVIKTLPCDMWEASEDVEPWLNFQEKLVKTGLLVANYHHPLLYQQLAEQYDNHGDGQLELAKLMPLLIRCGRIMGYAQKSELDNYPLERLNNSISQTEKLNLRHEAEKLTTKITMLAAIYYLINHYCTARQLELMPQLINYRSPTTDEERRSEKAIINSVSHQALSCKTFFAETVRYLDGRELIHNESLKVMSDLNLIPKTRTSLIKALEERPWVYAFIRQSRKLINEGDLLAYTLQLIREDFAIQKDVSYSAALAFAAAIRIQASSLLAEETVIVHSALYVFCLHVYEQERRVDNRPPALLGFSGETKCNAAAKKQQSVIGLRPNFSFFEAMALKQGRLGNLVEMFEGQDDCAKLR